MKKLMIVMIIVSTLAVLTGLGFLVYPKITDWRYAIYQKSLESSVVDNQEDGDGSKDIITLPDEAVCKIIIPKIGLDAYVLPGTDGSILKKGPGHYEETPLPGRSGNSAIAGHRTMYGHPFRHLNELNNGDQIIIYTSDGKFVYQVLERKIVRPTDLSVINQSRDTQLTLTTCHPIGSARQRLVVVALLEES